MGAERNRLTSDNSELVRKLGGTNNLSSSDGTVMYGMGSAQSNQFSHTSSISSSANDRRLGTGGTAGFRGTAGTAGTGGFGTLPSVLEEIRLPDEENDNASQEPPEIKIEEVSTTS